MASKESSSNVKEEDEETWRATLRSMLPAGVPIPDDESMDYSFATPYQGPRPSYAVPKAQPLASPPKPRPPEPRKRASRQSPDIPRAQNAIGSPSVAPTMLDDAQNALGSHFATPIMLDDVPVVAYSERIPVGVSAIEAPLQGLRSDSPDSAVSASTVVSQRSSNPLPAASRNRSDSEAEEADTHISPALSGCPSFGSSHRVVPAARILEKVDSLSYARQDDPAAPRSDFRFSGPHSKSCNASDYHFDGSNGFSQEMQEPTLADPTNQHRKKAGCHECLKGTRWQEKETCLVCNAKYCSSCVLKAMGSMPEGRKCVSCISHPIDESKRPNLGKPSRLLNRLLSPLEVQQIMKAERECPANQLRPEQLYVNEKQLGAQELAELLGCSNPPLKLKPGNYWYDKQTGHWGKKGEKPDKIITADLNVGGPLQENASGGCTKVFMNGREITKIELKLLKFAGVQCPPGTNLWVYDDGKYQEEGQNHFPGNIWKKATTRYLYPLFSLPTPHFHNIGLRNGSSSTGSVPAYLEQKKTYKLLLLGHEGSGTSTIFKQAKVLYEDTGFTQEELQNIKLMIQRNIYKYISILLEARERFEDEVEAAKDIPDECDGMQMVSRPFTTSNDDTLAPTFSGSGDSREKLQAGRSNLYTMNTRLKADADFILDTMANGHLDACFPAVTRENAPLVEDMWKDPAIQATYRRKAELHMLPDVAEYFLERVVDISSNDYEPSEQDILYAEGLTQGSGLAEIEFSLEERGPVSEAYDENYDQSSTVIRYHLIRINSKGMTGGCKWLEMFEDVRAVIFCVAIDEYDRMWMDGTTSLQNKLLLSRELFESVLKHPSFHDIPVVLLLNKYDAFEEKIESVPLTTCEWFSDFAPVRTSHHTPQTLAQQAYSYIAHKFKKHFETINQTGRKLYTFQLRARDRNTVSDAFQYVKEILKWDENKAASFWNLQEESTYTSEYSSFSPIVQANGH